MIYTMGVKCGWYINGPLTGYIDIALLICMYSLSKNRIMEYSWDMCINEISNGIMEYWWSIMDRIESNIKTLNNGLLMGYTVYM